MARLYKEEFHEFLETYGELLDQVECAQGELETVREEVSTRLDDLYGELEETMKLLRSLEQQVWQFRTYTVIKDQIQPEGDQIPLPASLEIDDNDPFSDIWKTG